MLYTHMAGLLSSVLRTAILIRDLAHRRRGTIPWLAKCPRERFVSSPTCRSRSGKHQMIYGHWLDYLGRPYHYPLPI